MTSRTFQFPAAMADELKKVPGVRQVDSVRLIIIDYQNAAPILISIEADQYLRRSQPIMEQGRVEDLLPGLQG